MASDETKQLIAENEQLKTELNRLNAENEKKNSETKIGLVWEHLSEKVDQILVDEVPVLSHVPNYDIKGALPSENAHILIEGDNLHALHTLQATHKNRVDVIYIDPPYNTGNEFIYNDKLIDKENRWRHSAWLSFMQKRLSLAADLLSDSGIIFISIDDNEQARLKLLCDEVFGLSNFVVCAPTIMNLKGNQDQFGFAGTHEYTMVYAKNIALAQFGKFPVDEEVVMDEWEEDDHGWWKQGAGLKATGANGPRVKRPNLWYALYVAKDGSYVSPTRKKKSDDEVWPVTNGQDMSWRWSSTTAATKSYDLIANGASPNWTIYKKQRPDLGDLPSKKPKSTLYRPEYSTTNGTNVLKKILGDRVFPNPKPVDLIKDLISISTKKDGAIVLDFFAGSGTTLHAVAQLNLEDGGTRSCILVTNNENGICREVTHPRCKAVLTGKWSEGNHAALPGSLAYYETAFIERRKSVDRMRAEICKHAIDFVAVKYGASKRIQKSEDLAILHSSGVTLAVAPSPYCDQQQVNKVAELAARSGDSKIAYVFTWADQGVEEETVNLWQGWEVRPLPAQMLAALRRLAPHPTLLQPSEEAE